MSVRKTAFERYLREIGQFESAACEVESLLNAGCRAAGLRADVKVRAKTVTSFIKKIHTKAYVDPWLETTDKVGGRVITETLYDLERVVRLFDGTAGFPLLQVLSIEDKSDTVDPMNLYYPGIHVQGVVPNVFTSDGERIECEIQLRTKAQDAWAVAGHGRIYKGIVALSKKTTRRLYRLSVLTEMFDEEVKTAMEEIHSEPGYEDAVLLRTIESLYLPLVGEPGDDALSFEVLNLLRGVINQSDREAYTRELTEFVDKYSLKISKILNDFGPHSSFAHQWAYWLFSQPESLVIFEKVQHDSVALSEAVYGTEMEDAFRHMFEAWGKVFSPTDDL